jgi:hypothetical protein
MADDVFNVCRAVIASKVAGLNLTAGSPAAPVPVEERKLPSEDEAFDHLPLIIVSLGPQQGPETPFESAGPAGATVKQDVQVQVVIISAGNRDVEGGLDDHPGWLRQIARVCSGPSLEEDIPGLLTCAVDTNLVIDRGLFKEGYDYSGLNVKLGVAVPAT